MTRLYWQNMTFDCIAKYDFGLYCICKIWLLIVMAKYVFWLYCICKIWFDCIGKIWLLIVLQNMTIDCIAFAKYDLCWQNMTFDCIALAKYDWYCIGKIWLLIFIHGEINPPFLNVIWPTNMKEFLLAHNRLLVEIWTYSDLNQYASHHRNSSDMVCCIHIKVCRMFDPCTQMNIKVHCRMFVWSL